MNDKAEEFTMAVFNEHVRTEAIDWCESTDGDGVRFRHRCGEFTRPYDDLAAEAKREAIEREKQMLVDELGKEREARETSLSAERAIVLLKAALEIRTRGWEYELRSSAPIHAGDGEIIQIGGHEATIRVPRGPEVTVLAFTPDVALKAALRGMLAALARQDPTGSVA